MLDATTSGIVMKVIGIGLEKTGTTTLKHALKFLGYNFCHQKDAFFQEKYNTLADYAVAGLLKKGSLEDFYHLASNADAFSDTPWPWLYKELDKKFPGSKFILTVRDEEKWIKSMVKYFGNIHSAVREHFYGHGEPFTHESQYRETYRKHLQEVQAYFKDRPNDLLVVNWEEDDGWTVLCTFLNKTIPDIPFPHENKYQNHKDKPKTFISGTLLLPKDSTTQLDALYFSFKHASGTRPSFIAFPDLKDSKDHAVRRFISGLQPKNHLDFIAKNIANFDCYCSVLPIPFAKIDAQHPGSKFVFLKSEPRALEDTLLGKLKNYVPFLPQFIINRYAAFLKSYEQNLQQYFKHRGKDFISIAIDNPNTQALMDFYQSETTT
jgi:hypothetical protein